MSPIATSICQLHQATMPNLHQRGDLIAPLPRHQGEMFIHMIWLTIDMMISIPSIIWIVMLSTSKQVHKQHYKTPEFVGNGAPRPCMTSQEWHLLSNEAKTIILGLCKNPGKRMANLHHISAFNFLQVNMHALPPESMRGQFQCPSRPRWWQAVSTPYTLVRPEYK